ncbi:MAG: peptidase [Phycisphaerae bacterium SM23_30]|nr:MAG: peptidase [Phycisphaerae bacterium SM23_30]
MGSLTWQEEAEFFEGCTSIMAGREATTDGSTITSHTCDGSSRTWLEIVRGGRNEPGETVPIYNKQIKKTEFAGDTRGLETLGEVPQAAETYTFVHTVYPCINEYQLAMGETTIGGRRELRSSEGIFSIEELQKVVMARTKTAREAIRMMGDLAEEYGYIDTGECLTVIDPEEAWFFEIFGPGKDRKGCVWAAVRIPDDEVAVSANIPRLGEVDVNDPDNYMASENVYSLAEEMGWWESGSGKPFKMWEAYSGRRPFGIREFWLLSQLAPSLNLRYFAQELPLSVKPDKKISARNVMDLLGSTYDGSDFDQCRNLYVQNGRNGKMELSPAANPWMSSHTRNLLNALQPGAVERQRTVAVNQAAYSTVIQCRDWLPDPVGGVLWLGFDCPKLIPRIPIFAGTTELPPEFAVSAQHRFRRDCASWAFHRACRLSQITYQRDKEIILQVRKEVLDRAFAELPEIEKEAVKLYYEDPDRARQFVNDYSNDFARAVVQRMWDLGDELWSKYVRGF